MKAKAVFGTEKKVLKHREEFEMKNRAPAMITEQFIGLLDELLLVACGSRQKKRGTVVYTFTLEDILEGSAIINRGEIRNNTKTEEVSKESRPLDGPVDCKPIPVARSG